MILQEENDLLVQKLFSKPLNDISTREKIKYMNCIPDSVIDLFYNNPQQFFEQSEQLLQNTNYLDKNITGHTIFYLYFVMILDKKNKNKIYEENLVNFLEKHKDYITAIDLNMDLILHKFLFSYSSNNPFFTIFMKLKDNFLITEQLLTYENYYKKSIIGLMKRYTKVNFVKLTKDNDRYINYSNFWNFIIKKYPSIYNSFSINDQLLINDFLNKNLLTYGKAIKRGEFKTLYNSLLNIIKEKSDKLKEELNSIQEKLDNLEGNSENENEKPIKLTEEEEKLKEELNKKKDELNKDFDEFVKNTIYMENIQFNYLNYFYKNSKKKINY